jgi:hypothetical protein
MTTREEELAEIRRLKRCQTLRECPDPRWKLIQHLTMEREGELFERKLWVAVCGGAVEYIEGITPEGKRVYQVERFELKPESWAKEQVIAPPCSMIDSDRFEDKKQALEKVEYWKETIKPFWYKVKKEREKTVG